jgi:hypothetical protein
MRLRNGKSVALGDQGDQAMMKQDLKRTQVALARAGYIFTGFDWTGTARSAAPAVQSQYTLDPIAEAREARRVWRQRSQAARRAAARREKEALHDRVAAWAHARVPGDPCIGAGC